MSVEEEKGIRVVKTLANLPQVSRGYGYTMHWTSKKKPEFVYTNKNSVILRSLEDFTDCSNYDGHKGKNATCANFSTNGEWVASGDEHGQLKIWGRKNKFDRYEYPVLAEKINDISWDADSKRLIAVGNGSKPPYAKVLMWDSGSSVGGIEGAAQTKSILSAEYSKQRPYKIITAGEDNGVTLHSGPPFKANWAKCTAADGGHTRYPNKVRFNNDYTKFATVGSDSKILIFDTKEATVKVDDKPTKQMKASQELKDENGHTGAIWSFDWSGDGTELLTCGADKTAKIWNVESGKVTTTFTIAETPTTDDMQMSALWCGETLLTVSLSGAINVLDREKSNAPKQVIHGHKGQVKAVAVGSDGTFFTVGTESKICRWTSFAAQWLENRPEKKAINHVALSHDEKTLITTGFDNKLVFSDSTTEGKVSTSVDLGKPAACLAAGKATGVVAVAVGDNVDIYKQDGESWAKGNTIELKDRASSVDFSGDDSLIAVAVGKTVFVYDQEGKEAWTATHHYNIGKVSWSPCGKYLGFTCKSSTFIMRKEDWKQVNKADWEFHSGLSVFLLWSKDGKKCVTVSNDDTMIVWNDTENFGTGKREKKIGLHINGIETAAMLDNDRVLTVGQDGVMKVWAI